MNKVIIATQNRNKVREFDDILTRHGISAIARDDAGLPKDEVEETGTTMEENSYIKAKAIRDIIDNDPTFAEYKDCIVIADDTGLMVDALDGAPGVYSARYAGEGCTYADNCVKMLKEMDGVPYEKRTAYFQTVITMIYPDGSVRKAIGECHGHIGEECRGEEGFGYDPLFIPDGYDTTFAEVGLELKNKVSHRARALEEMERII